MLTEYAVLGANLQQPFKIPVQGPRGEGVGKGKGRRKGSKNQYGEGQRGKGLKQALAYVTNLVHEACDGKYKNKKVLLLMMDQRWELSTAGRAQ